jgi:hypothetical protein
LRRELELARKETNHDPESLAYLLTITYVTITYLLIFTSFYRRHTEVANNFDDKELAQWVRKQRQTWKRRSEGKVTRMSNDQVDKLDSLGFSWTVSRGRKPIETKKSKKSSKPSRK